MNHNSRLESVSRNWLQSEHYDPASTADFSEIVALVHKEIALRSRRSRILSPHLFADPAWDMLLELFRAELGQYKVSVSQLCIASRVPATTSLRWISTLDFEGLVTRDADRFDGRRHYVRLTDAGSRAMKSYFSRRPVDLEAQL